MRSCKKCGRTLVKNRCIAKDCGIRALEKQIAKIEAKAVRDSLKYDDCGPLDVASEKTEELRKEIKFLKKRK